MANEKILTPVMFQIEHTKEVMKNKAPNSAARATLEVVVTALETVLPDERQALLVAHSVARGQQEIDSIAILWFTNTFEAYKK